MKNNVIPRKFLTIIGETKIETSETSPGDEIHVFKDDTGYLGYNIETRRFFRIFPAMLRNINVFKINDIIKQ